MLAALVCACAPVERSPSLTAARWGREIQPFHEVDVVVLTPSNPRDNEFILSGLGAERQNISGFRWLADSTSDGLDYRDLAAMSDSRASRRRMRECACNGSETRTGTAQLIVIAVTVDRDGVVLEGSVPFASTTDSDVLSCLLQSVMTWRFPAQTTEQTFDIPIGIVPADGEANGNVTPCGDPLR